MLKRTSVWKVAALTALLALSPWSWAGGVNTIEENPSALAMSADLLLVRPVMLATTIVGSVVWLVSLPFSAFGDNMMQAADTLVVGPGKATFVRCLGCVGDGYKNNY